MINLVNVLITALNQVVDITKIMGWSTGHVRLGIVWID
jgi:hypothetical protein